MGLNAAIYYLNATVYYLNAAVYKATPDWKLASLQHLGYAITRKVRRGNSMNMLQFIIW